MRGSEGSHHNSSPCTPISTTDVVHIQAKPRVRSYFRNTFKSGLECEDITSTDPESAARDNNNTKLEENEIPMSPTSVTSYCRLISMDGAAASCGLITELNLCDFAHQIATGLQHLESLNVSDAVEI